MFSTMTAGTQGGDPVVVCVTPVRDERAVLERFLACAALWADHIVVLDQCSTDGSREVAAAHPKVRLLLNDDPTYDEAARQRVLLGAAREIPGRRVLVALDADEALSANVLRSRAWHDAIRAAPGTILRLRWASILPGFARAWISPDLIAFGLVDDGRVHTGPPIHSRRLPAGLDQPSLALEDVRVLHYQFATYERNRSKQRWYQCWERLHDPRKRPIQIYRQYHRLDALPDAEVQPLRADWFGGYMEAGLDMRSLPPPEPWYRWDEEVLDWLVEHGPSKFERLDIWDLDYEALARRLGRPTDGRPLGDPRGPGTRLIHRALARTQAHAGRRGVRLVQRALIPFGW
jgi:glycosyltransferase involved in cell wall biosynthesis